MKRLIFLMIASGLITGLSGVTVCAAEVVKAKLTGQMPVGSSVTVAGEKFVKAVEKRSNGTIQITFYPAGQLAKEVKAMDMVQKGGIQMAQFFASRAVGIIPEVQYQQAYFDDVDWFARRLYDPQSGGGFFQKYLKPAFGKNGMYLLLGFLNNAEFSTITVKKPVYKVEDYKGLKLRVSGRELGIAAESWGAKSVVMSSADVYMALQRGILDGANSGVGDSFVSRKWYEVSNYVQLLWETPTISYIICNLRWWKGLTDDQRSIITESARDAALWNWQDMIDATEKHIQFLKDKGLEVFDFRRQAAEEHNKMRELTIKALERELASSATAKAIWDDNIRMLRTTKDGIRTWKDILKSHKF